MSTAKMIPAKTETKVVEVSPAKVVLELSMDQALAVYKAANHASMLQGHVAWFTEADGENLGTLYRPLRELGFSQYDKPSNA